MTDTERYNSQRRSSKNDQDPIERHLMGLARLIATATASTVNNWLDEYILAKVEMRNQYRAYFDMRKYEEVKKAMEEDVRETLSKELDQICDEFNKTGKIKVKR